MSFQIRSLEDLAGLEAADRKAVCLYSGGLDSTFLLAYLARVLKFELVALHVDLGRSVPWEKLMQGAGAIGVKSVTIDAEKEFAQDFVRPALCAHATYLGGHPISASLSRPLIAKQACQFAEERNFPILLHTSTPTQNSLRRFNTAIQDLGFKGKYGSPFETDHLRREEKMKFLKEEGVEGFEASPFSSDVNFWCREVEFGELDDPEAIDLAVVPFQLKEVDTTLPEKTIKVVFKEGLPISVNDQKGRLEDLVRGLDDLLEGYGVGRFRGLEELASGLKVQEFREMPGAHLLLEAFRALESASLPAETLRVKQGVEQVWVREAVEGRWFQSLREACQAFILSTSVKVSGTVTLRVAPHRLELEHLKAEKPLYIRDRNLIEGA